LKYEFFDWQKQAIQNFIAYSDSEYEFEKDETFSHLLFNMAT
jgi:hypothetical protein